MNPHLLYLNRGRLAPTCETRAVGRRDAPQLTACQGLNHYWPKPTETSIDVNLTEEVDQLLQSLLATGDYLETKEHALLHSFLRWYDVAWPRDHVSTKLKFWKQENHNEEV